MKLITVIISVFTITSAIRVPTTWPTQQFRTPSVGSEIQARPHVIRKNQINSGRYRNPKTAQFKASATPEQWRPIFPAHMIQEDDSFYDSFKVKNYRDDKTHEPSEESEEIEDTRYDKVTSSHEAPLDIPTRPVYPGEGRWAQKGKKHKPFISPHKFTEEEEEEEDEERPRGHEVFDQNKRLYQRQRQHFREGIDDLPRKHKLGSWLPAPQEESDEDYEEQQEFVPTKIYTQVRRVENEEHLPRLVEDPRLREVIKDSKIQTVYTEEGYEDLAYDHAGHEKNAEHEEGSSEFDREIEKERRKQAQDSTGAGSHRVAIKKPNQSKKNRFTKTKERKTAQIQDKDGKNSELEISTEVQVLEVPNQKTKTHKYVTIVPKMYDRSNVAKAIVPVGSNYRSRYKKRYKRFTVDFPEIKAETDFIDKIKHNLPKKVPKSDINRKYPYYNDPGLHHYSPLRYSENLDNIPKKTGDDLAFYNQADAKVECAEVESNVDPIPARVKSLDRDPENTDTSGVQELPELPRLKNLGDKIDCFKAKYFGENPLDSPFFQEKEIGPVLPIFQYFPSPKQPVQAEEEEEEASYSTKVPVHEKAEEGTKTGVQDDLNLNILSDVVHQLNKAPEATTTAPAVLRLEIVPQTTQKPENQTVISIITTPKYTIDLTPKHIYHQIELLEYLPTYNPSKSSNESSIERLGKSMDEEATTVAPPSDGAPPESLALRYRRRRIRPVRPGHPHYHIFDVNRYLPHNSFNLLNRIIRTSTEAAYKQEIKPSEQLNVFADVINNIKNSSRDPQQIAATSNRISVKLNTIPVVETDLDNIEETNSFYLTTTTTAAPRGTIKYNSYKNKEHLLEEASKHRGKFENLELLKINKRLTTTTETYKPAKPVVEEEEEEEPEATTVLGLMPPTPNRYKTIYTKPAAEETKMNLFYVLGMKPPSPKQKVYLYSDFKPRKNKYAYLRRGKRSAQRPSYSEVVRNRNKPIDVEDDTEVVVEEDDDYVPHRPKNYHYDEKTGRIIYDNPKKEEPEEEEYIEVTEAPVPKPSRRKPAPPLKFENFTGPSFVDFVKKLKTDPKYQEITDPPSTEKPPEDATTTTTTAKPVSTTPPEFLSILAKVRSSDNYKEIKDKNATKTTTTQVPEVVEEEEEETQLENVQNSPGGQTIGQNNYQIFDINEYLPKVKTYSPRTSIDYSKYKTIERPTVAPRPEEDLEEAGTPANREVNPVMSESKHEDVEPTTTTEAPTTRRIRTRTRGTRRPTQRVTTGATSSSAVEEVVRVQHDKPKRVFPRRRPTHIRSRTTTESSDSEIEESNSAKIIRRRHQKSEDVPITKYKVAAPNQEEIAKLNKTRGELRKIADVQVFEKYDHTKKHGGNFKEASEVKRLTDVVHKPSEYYTDPKLSTKVNQLMEVKDVPEEEDSEKEETATDDFDYEEATTTTTTTTTKKPVFVKDPDKRMYYYAPV